MALGRGTGTVDFAVADRRLWIAFFRRGAAGEEPPKIHRHLCGALDTVTTLTAWCGEESLFQEAAALAEKELNRLSSLYDRYDPDSALSRLNSAEGDAVPVPDELSSLLAYCIEQSGRYPGCNIALGGVTALWEQARETGFLPSEEALAGRQGGIRVCPPCGWTGPPPPWTTRTPGWIWRCGQGGRRRPGSCAAESPGT